MAVLVLQALEKVTWKRIKEKVRVDLNEEK